MNVFITGAGGFIGKRLLALIAKDERFGNVYCLCRGGKTVPDGFTAVSGSLESLDSVPAVEADVCIHLAAVTNNEKQGDGEVDRVNAQGTANVIEYCKKSGIKRIIFLSSVNTYLSRKYEYSLSKLRAEDIIMNSGLEYTVLRCALVYGEGCKSFEKILKTAKIFHAVPILGNGKAAEQPIYVDEVCRAVLALVFGGKGNAVFDLCGKTTVSYNEMVKALLAAADIKAALLHIPSAPVIAAAEFCAKHGIPFPINPEQISHMCEDLCFEDRGNFAAECGFEDFTVNLEKYMKK